MSHKQLYTIHHYQYSFTQPFPAYGKKDTNGWKTIYQPLNQRVIHQHLTHEISIGTYGRWYPQFGIIDIDDVEISQLYEIRSRLGMDDSNSLIFTSESANSYHIYFKPTRRGKLMNLNLYLKCMASTRELMNIEIYPQANHLIRLPFGKGQQLLSDRLAYPIDYQKGMDLLYRLAEFDVDKLPYLPGIEESQPTHLLLNHPSPVLESSWKYQGLELINSGLQAPGTRLESLKRIIYFYWSQNVPLESTMHLTKAWIDAKHHGYSKDYHDNPYAVYQQIEALTRWIYQHFDHHYILPDSAHIIDKGYLTASLTHTLVSACQGNLPLLKFALQLFAYLCARDAGGNKVAIHRDRLTEWSSTNNYLRYLQHFQERQLIFRDARYKVGHYAKGIRLTIPTQSIDHAIKIDDTRPAHSLHEIIPRIYTPQSYAQHLQSLHLERSVISKQIYQIWQKEISTPIYTKKQKTKNRIESYRMTHPQATQQEIANALNLSLRTVKSYAKKNK